HAVDRAELHRSCELANHGEECGACLAIPDHLRPSVDAFASRFAQLTNGWEQVDALLEHLRTHYEHHRDDMVPGTCEDPVHYFLHHSRGGPAYQFVTTAALALRSLGYPTRVVSGFYVGEEKFIARTGHTPVHLDDAHLWIEVRTDTGRWITLDPTPGYEMEWYSASLYDRLKTLGVAIMYPFKTYPVWSSAALVVAVFLFVRRLWIRERLCTLWCMWWPSRYVNRRLVLTLHTLDLRSRLCGSGRPPEATPLAWYGRVDDGDCYDFLQCLYRALYGQMESEADEITHACRAALRSTGTTKLRTRLNKS
ncbi:MAG: transglutaminase-like domain-containing protein, partial [Phycisphaerae bacterium]